MAYNVNIDYEQPNTEVETFSSIKSGLGVSKNENSPNNIAEGHTNSAQIEEIDLVEFDKPEGCVEYIALSGETFESIAEDNGITTNELRRLNKYIDEDITEGDIVYIPENKKNNNGSSSTDVSNSNSSGNGNNDSSNDTNSYNQSTNDLRNLKLEDLKKISDEYKKRIEQLMEDYGYTPEEFDRIYDFVKDWYVEMGYEIKSEEDLVKALELYASTEGRNLIDFADDMIIADDTVSEVHEEDIDWEAKEKETTENLNYILEVTNKRIAELTPEVEELESDHAIYLTIIQNNLVPTAFNDTDYLEKIIKIEKELEPKKQELNFLTITKKELEHSIELSPYRELYKSNNCQKYIDSYDSSWQDLDYEALMEFGYDWPTYLEQLSMSSIEDDMMSAFSDTINIGDEKPISSKEIDEFALLEYAINNYKENGLTYEKRMEILNQSSYLRDIYDKYKYLSEEQIMVYHYLFQNEGKESADKFLEIIDDDINKAKGTAMALNFINGLDLTDEGQVRDTINNLLDVTGQGLIDGENNFFTGLARAFATDNKISADDYKKMIILQYLEENSVFHDDIYEFSSAFGNMLPALTASAIVSAIATPAGGASIMGVTIEASQLGAMTATTLIGMSAMGNATHNALVNGASPLSASIYGMFIGLSESCLNYFLGNLPGISSSYGFTLRDILREGVEEYSQDWIAAGLQAVILGQDVAWSNVPEQAAKSFLMGALMSGFLNGGQEVVGITINGIEYTIDVVETIKYMYENNVDIEQAIEVLNPALSRYISDNYTTMTKEDIVNKIKKITLNDNSKIPDAIKQLLENEHNGQKNYADLRLICRVGLDYMEQNGYSSSDSAKTIGKIYADVLENVGFDSYIDPTTGIKINVIKKMDWNKQVHNPTDAINFLSTLPKEFTALLTKINYYDTFNPYDFFWELEYNKQNFKSAATGGDGVIFFWANDYADNSTITHEIGHTYDRAKASEWGVTTGRISESEIWLDAMKADEQTSGLSGVSEYARSSNSPVEDFADSVRLFYSDPNALDLFPARKELLTKYLPQSETIATAYDTVYDAMVQKVGKAKTDVQFKNYYDSGNINSITDEGARKMIEKYSIKDFRDFMDQSEILRINDKKRAVEYSFNLSMGALIRKYGREGAIRQMQAFLNTGETKYITKAEGARSSMTYSLEEYIQYVKMINKGSLDVSKMVTKGGYKNGF